jgi:hypothetical protein
MTGWGFAFILYCLGGFTYYTFTDEMTAQKNPLAMKIVFGVFWGPLALFGFLYLMFHLALSSWRG